MCRRRRHLSPEVLQLVADKLPVAEWARTLAQTSRELRETVPAELAFQTTDSCGHSRWTVRAQLRHCMRAVGTGQTCDC